VSQCKLDVLKKVFSGSSLVVIDEAQRIENIGRAVKLMVDNSDSTKFILTGSSSFDLANTTGETLTGRKTVLTLYTVSHKEIVVESSQFEAEKMLTDNLIYGSYPSVLLSPTYDIKEEKLREIVNSYLLKDILAFNLVKDSKTIRDLLKLLAFQIGNEVSLNELASSLEIDKNTVARHLDILEKSFVIFSLGGFSRNLRKEVYKSQKYYFYDLGIRNTIIANLNAMNLRNDIGQLWENYMIIERMKANAYSKKYPNYYFWRTYDKKEVDLIEEIGGNLNAFEFKWSKDKVSSPKEFLESYSNSTYQIVSKENFYDFIDY
jgi:hypothetical protein